MYAKTLQLCPTLCDCMNCILSGSSVRGILQARVLEWGAIAFSVYAEYIIWNAQMDEVQARIEIAGGNINNLRYSDDTTLMKESEEELKSLLKVKEESEKTQHSKN